MFKYIFLGFMCFFSGCLGRNVAEGDADYPVQNTAPMRVTKVSGYLSPDLDVRFEAIYAADQPWVPKDDSCGYYSSFISKYEVGLKPFSFRLPLEITRDGDQYSFSIAADRFLPGRCNWALDGVYIHVAQNSDAYACDLYRPNNLRSPKTPKPPSLPGVEMNVRCGPEQAGANSPILCYAYDEELGPSEKQQRSIYFGPGPSEQIMNIRGTQHTNAM